MKSSLPEKYTMRMQRMLGDAFFAFLESYEKPRHQALRLNPLKLDADTIKGLHTNTDTSLHATGELAALRPVPWCITGFYYPDTLRPGKHPFHEAGAYYIQEPSAMAPATFLDAQPGQFVLDLCAAPGGKSTQIAAAMQNQGLLVSNEIHPARAKILSENIERMGIANAIVTNESPASLAALFPAYFDRIMVDAPCSGEGMFRKNELACSEWSEENVRMCAHRQDEILGYADQMLKPGGRIVYSTCTFAPMENEGTIGRFLSAHPQYRLLAAPICGGLSHGFTDDGSLCDCEAFRDTEFAAYVAEHVIRLWPHKVAGEGHFVAILQKGDPAPQPLPSLSRFGKLSGIPVIDGVLQRKEASSGPKKGKRDGAKYDKKSSKTKAAGSVDLTALQSFMKNYVNLKWNGILTSFGDQLYLLPAYAPSLTGLKVLRPGLHLGCLQKDRFEPSHALALFLKPEQARYSCDLSSAKACDLMTACRFIEGQTFPYEGEKGWYLISLDGISLGWGRLAGGIMKNYYPKGLRKVISSSSL